MATTRQLCLTAALAFLGLGLFGACEGPAGPQGAPGEQGPVGEPGPPGEDGISVAGVMCDPGEAVIGFDEEGGVVCGRISGAEVSPASPGDHDTTPPTLAAFELQPEVVSLPGEIVFTARIVDEGAGNVVDEFTHEDINELGDMTSDAPPVSHALFASPDGNHFFFVVLAGHELVEGTPQDGVYEYTATLRQGLSRAVGEWNLQYVVLVDQAGNSRRLTAGEIGAAGMPTSFMVE